MSFETKVVSNTNYVHIFYKRQDRTAISRSPFEHSILSKESKSFTIVKGSLSLLRCPVLGSLDNKIIWVSCLAIDSRAVRVHHGNEKENTVEFITIGSGALKHVFLDSFTKNKLRKIGTFVWFRIIRLAIQFRRNAESIDKLWQILSLIWHLDDVLKETKFLLAFPVTRFMLINLSPTRQFSLLYELGRLQVLTISQRTICKSIDWKPTTLYILKNPNLECQWL